MSISQLRMVSSAASCFSGVTPAQSDGLSRMGTSGSDAFASSALLTTQMSVQSPQNSIDVMGLRSFSATSQRDGAKRGLLERAGVAGLAHHVELGHELPAKRSLDAVGHGQVPALLRLKVVGTVRVERERDGAVELACAPRDVGRDRLGLGAA